MIHLPIICLKTLVNPKKHSNINSIVNLNRKIHNLESEIIHINNRLIKLEKKNRRSEIKTKKNFQVKKILHFVYISCFLLSLTFFILSIYHFLKSSSEYKISGHYLYFTLTFFMILFFIRMFNSHIKQKNKYLMFYRCFIGICSFTIYIYNFFQITNFINQTLSSALSTQEYSFLDDFLVDNTMEIHYNIYTDTVAQNWFMDKNKGNQMLLQLCFFFLKKTQQKHHFRAK